MTPTNQWIFFDQGERLCMKCRKKLSIDQFTSSGLMRSNVCDTCLEEWRKDQLAKGHTGATRSSHGKKSLGKNNP